MALPLWERLPSLSRNPAIRTDDNSQVEPRNNANAVEDGANTDGKTTTIYRRGLYAGIGKKYVISSPKYVISSPKDSSRQFRQKFLSFQELHRGVARLQKTVLPEVPFRFIPKPEVSSTSRIFARSHPVLKAGFIIRNLPPIDEELKSRPSETISVKPSAVRSFKFILDPEVTFQKVAQFSSVKKAEFVEKNTLSDKGTAEPSSLFENPPGKSLPKRSVQGGCFKHDESLADLSHGLVMRSSQAPNNLSDDFFKLPNMENINHRPIDDPRKAVDTRVADLTQLRCTFTSKFESIESGKSVRSFKKDLPEKAEPTNGFFQKRKPKYLQKIVLDDIPSDFKAQRKKQKAAQGTFSRIKTFKICSTISSECAFRVLMEVVNCQLVDKSGYDKFARQRKPYTLS